MFNEFSTATTPESHSPLSKAVALELTGKSPEELNQEDFEQVYAIIDIEADKARKDPRYANMSEKEQNSFVNRQITDGLLGLFDIQTKANIHYATQKELSEAQANVTAFQDEIKPDPYNRSSVQ